MKENKFQESKKRMKMKLGNDRNKKNNFREGKTEGQ